LIFRTDNKDYFVNGSKKTFKKVKAAIFTIAALNLDEYYLKIV